LSWNCYVTQTLRLPLLVSSLALLTLLGSCGELNAPGEALSLFASTVDPVYLDEEYTFDFVVSGGLAPYIFEVRSGTLPPGLELANGSISGTPTEQGSFSFSLQVSDANLSQAVEDYTVTVTPAPPAELVLNVPPTTISETVRIPISVREARNLQALRTQISWSDLTFEFVPGSVRAAQGSLVVLQRAREGQLNINLTFLGPSLNGDAELFSFELRPLEPSTLTLEARTEYRSRDGEHGFSSTQDGDDQGFEGDDTSRDTSETGTTSEDNGSDGSGNEENSDNEGSDQGDGSEENDGGGF